MASRGHVNTVNKNPARRAGLQGARGLFVVFAWKAAATNVVVAVAATALPITSPHVIDTRVLDEPLPRCVKSEHDADVIDAELDARSPTLQEGVSYLFRLFDDLALVVDRIALDRDVCAVLLAAGHDSEEAWFALILGRERKAMRQPGIHDRDQSVVHLSAEATASIGCHQEPAARVLLEDVLQRLAVIFRGVDQG